LERRKNLGSIRNLEGRDSAVNVHVALDLRRDDVEKYLRSTHDQVPERRPTFGATMAVEGPFLDLLAKLGWLTVDEKPVVRLHTLFSDPRQVIRYHPDSRGIKVVGFDLMPGINKAPRSVNGSTWRRTIKIVEARRRTSLIGMPWTFGPKWKYAREPGRLALMQRAVELGAARIAEFVEAPADQMEIGGIVCGACCLCGRPLTDPVSIARGIGPECGGRPRAIWSTARTMTPQIARVQRVQREEAPGKQR
jgi:Family of unknown function (DUF6011)